MAARKRSVDFKNPPVVETALGVMFAPIKSWNLLHYGLLWARYRQAYPNPEVKLPTGAIQFDEFDLRLGENVDLRTLPLRCWFVDATNHQLLQVQRNCFIRNWRKIDDTHEYTHYDEIRPLFDTDWRKFKLFLQDEKLDLPSLWHTEVTYINHLVRGREWNSVEDLKRIFPLWDRQLSAMYDMELNSFAFGAQLVEGGQLQVNVQPGLRPDGKQIFQLTISVIQVPKDSSDESLMQALDRGHDRVVNYFAEITSAGSQSVWERIDANA